GWCLELLLPLLLNIKDVSGQWNVWVPRDVSAMTNSCVVIYFTFMYAATPRHPRHLVLWQALPPALPTCGVQDIARESYKGRTKLIGDLHQRNCTLLISNIGTEHSLRYYFRADLDGANIYTYPDFSELKAHIDIPAEIVADDVGMLQHPPDNCPENSLEIQWMYTDYMPEPHYTLDYVEESNTAALSSTLTFTTKPIHNGRQTVLLPGREQRWTSQQLWGGSIVPHYTTLHHRNSTYQSYLSSDATLILEESMCTVVREGVQCVFLATGNPEPIIECYLPDKNINDTDGLYNYYMHMDGHMSMGMIKLREKGEQPGHCSVSNMYRSESFYLELQQEYMMAGIVGTIVGVAVIAFIIAAVRYVGHNNKKENGNPGRYLVSKLENPALYYSTVKKDKQCLRKKVPVILNGPSLFPYLQGEDGDYQPVGSLADLERQELKCPALEFQGGAPRMGGPQGGGMTAGKNRE
uniref:Uncharacterized protein n=1 Tax=Salmo trutta TaxID=8032 RepID=A0A674CKF6_SALTR